MKYKHYAPNAQVYMVRPDTDWQQVKQWLQEQAAPIGVMATDSILQQLQLPATDLTFSLGTDVTTAAHRLFDGLRTFDHHPTIKQILVQAFPATGLGLAYMNRLNKSAGGQYFKY